MSLWGWIVKGKEPEPFHGALVETSWEALGMFLGKGNRFDHVEVTEGVPAGAQIVAVHVDPRRRSVWLTVQHPELPMVPEGTELSPLRVEFMTHACGYAEDENHAS